MTKEYCDKCTNVKLYDGLYRCMTCFKQFIATEEDVMNSINVAPAIERIKELENENSNLKNTIAAMKQVMTAMRNPVSKDASAGVSGMQHPGSTS